jgi:hypothetical protein
VFDTAARNNCQPTRTLRNFVEPNQILNFDNTLHIFSGERCFDPSSLLRL